MAADVLKNRPVISFVKTNNEKRHISRIMLFSIPAESTDCSLYIVVTCKNRVFH